MQKSNKKNNLIFYILILFFLMIFLFASYKIYNIKSIYKHDEQIYIDIINEYVTVKPATTTSNVKNNSIIDNSIINQLDVNKTIQDPEPPIEIDWNGLLQRNSDIIGWIYIEGQPNISYPILQGETNNTYLHSDIDKNYLYSGCIFLDSSCAKDFSYANSIIYGHHMKDGSMFKNLKYMCNQEYIDNTPYIWILTPVANYIYQIYVGGFVNYSESIYRIFPEGTDNFVKWANDLKQFSEVYSDIEITAKDHIIMLSTCAYNDKNRNIIAAVCISNNKPPINKNN